MKKLLFLYLLLLLPISATADDSGTCGENTTWYYEEGTKTLTISGTGSMPDWTSPWDVYKENIQVIIINAGVTSIGAGAFLECTALTSVTIPSSVTSIGIYAFYCCTALTSVNIPEGVTGIGMLAFCSTALTNVSIPEGVTFIGERAFYNCTALTSVTIPSSVTNIYNDAFLKCSGLTSVTINSNAIMSKTYDTGCSLCHIFGNQVENYNIGEGVTSIGNYAFCDCTGLTSVTIPSSVTRIGFSAFRDCTGLTSVTIPSGVTSIYSAFSGCTGLTKVIVPDIAAWCCITFLGNNSNPLSYAHHLYSDENTEITNLVIPTSVTSIAGEAFYGCTGLTSVTFPSSLTSIGGCAFYGCSGLTSVTIPEGVTTIDNSVFENCTGLTNVTIPEGVTSIGRYAFYGCTAMTKLKIPNTLSSIDESAFEGWEKLSTIILGNGIKTINSKAFANCTNLNDVYCLAYRYPTTAKNAFDGSYPDYVTLHVLDEAVEQYRAVEPWSTFKDVIGLEGSTGSTPCAKPTISYKNGQIETNCDTDGAQCVTIITVDDAKTYTSSKINLNVTYHISVYAIKPGYGNSEVATATLCWIDVEPQTEGVINSIAHIPAIPVLIQSENGQINVTGVDDGTAVSVYNVDGMKTGSGIVQEGQVIIDTRQSAGSIAIVKIGEKRVKVVMR